ncbi:hypothetical protein ALO39_200042 [Pseudomonas syringae pv. lapsa]|nr:hypothetical protein ALO39_200042 [Pseudomonas syringae pv. lapsa]
MPLARCGAFGLSWGPGTIAATRSVLVSVMNYSTVQRGQIDRAKASAPA